jgi:hypothetical protein
LAALGGVLQPALPQQSVSEAGVESNQKARFVSDWQGDPVHEQARRVWVEETWPAILKQAQAQGAVILFADEVSFALWVSLSRTWAPRGQQPVVKTAGRRKGMKLLGAIEFFSGALDSREAVGYTLNATALKRLKAEGVPAGWCKHCAH